MTDLASPDAGADAPAEPSAAPARARRLPRPGVTTATVIAFALTMLVAALLVLNGLVPLGRISLGQRVDLGALLFVAPVLALVLAVILEAARIALRSPDLPEPRRVQTLRWTPARPAGKDDRAA